MKITFRWLRGNDAYHGDIRHLWEEGYSADSSLPFVLSPTFADLVTEIFRPPVEPVCLLAIRGREPVGLIPLALRRHPSLGWGVRQLLHRNEWHTYYSDPICLESKDGEVRSSLLNELRRSTLGDISDLQRCRIDREGHASRDNADTTADPRVVHSLALPKLSKNRRSTMGRSRRRFEEAPGAVIEEHSNPEMVRRLSVEFAEMHTRLKEWQVGWPLFKLLDGAAERLPAALASLAETGSVSYLRLAIAGNTVGLSLLLHRPGESTVSWRVAWDPDWAHLGLGILLTGEAIRLSALRDEKVHFLGPGPEPHKRIWANDVGEVERIRSPRPSLRYRLVSAAERLTKPY